MCIRDRTLTVYDYNVNEVMTLSSTLHVVEQLEGEYSIMNMGDSLSCLLYTSRCV